MLYNPGNSTVTTIWSLSFRCKADLWRRLFRLSCVFEIGAIAYIKSVITSGKLHGLVNLFFFLSGVKLICGDDYSDLFVYLRCVTNSGKQHGHIFCCFSFRCKADLETHSVVHSKEKPHSCHICNTSFTQKSSLKGDWPNLTLQSIKWPKITKYNLS